MGVWEEFSHSFQHPQALVPSHQLDPFQLAAGQPLEEADPTGLVLFHSLSGTQNLTVSILVYCNCNQNRNILKLSAPIATQVDAVTYTYG